jgi:hypothetical protein
MDQNGTLDFGEFLSLMFLWTAVGEYKTIFTLGENAEIVSDAFADIQDLFKTYDRAGKLVLEQEEVEDLVADHLNPLSPLPWLHEKRGAITCPQLLHALYAACAEYPENKIPGKHKDLSKTALAQCRPWSKRLGPRSTFWVQLRDAFLVLERDFSKLDIDQNGVIDYAELTNGVQALVGEERLRILARLEYKFNKVDLDHSRSVDFYEYLHLSLLMIQDGSYSDLRQDTSNRSVIKRTLLDVHRYYVKYSKQSNFRLSHQEISQFISEVFGVTREDLADIMLKVGTPSRTAQNAGLCIDIVRFMKLLYFITCPDGPYSLDSGYDPHKTHKPRQLLSMHLAPLPGQLLVIDPVHVAKFKRGKLLGEGSQGRVFEGQYRHGGVSHKVAGKVMIKKPTEQICQELAREAGLMRKLEHPNCHVVFGAKCSLADGGPLILTEVCSEGSLFDLYAKRQVKFDPRTAWRIAIECASGLQAVHKLAYMHRDVKSLNILLTDGFRAKLADFGLATNATSAYDACGTVQWMAPEVLRNYYHPHSSQYDKRCDLYSFGVLLWEIVTCQCPYGNTGKNQMQIARLVMEKNWRPELLADMNPVLSNVVTTCWQRAPDLRPSLDAVLKILIDNNPNEEHTQNKHKVLARNVVSMV